MDASAFDTKIPKMEAGDTPFAYTGAFILWQSVAASLSSGHLEGCWTEPSILGSIFPEILWNSEVGVADGVSQIEEYGIDSSELFCGSNGQFGSVSLIFFSILPLQKTCILGFISIVDHYFIAVFRFLIFYPFWFVSYNPGSRPNKIEFFLSA